MDPKTATTVSWKEIQNRIWRCEECKVHQRVETNIRQQTPTAPTRSIVLLFVGVAPPDQGSPSIRTIAKSATNHGEDNLRMFIENETKLTWNDLIAKGVFLIHAVKCAIHSNKDGFQNPPNDVVDCCGPIGFTDELRLLSPNRIVTLGKVALRAVLNHPAVTVPKEVGISMPLKKIQELGPRGILCDLSGIKFVLHPAPFPRGNAKCRTAKIIKETVHLTCMESSQHKIAGQEVCRFLH